MLSLIASSKGRKEGVPSEPGYKVYRLRNLNPNSGFESAALESTIIYEGNRTNNY